MADFNLTLDVLEEGDYGNNFGTAVNDEDGVVTAEFTGTTQDQILSFTAFDIDFGNEVKVLLNGELIGFLDAGVDEGFSQHQFTITAEQQALFIGQPMTISFVQDIDPNWKWGVTDILLGAAPEPPAIVPDFTLTLDILEEGDYGNNFGTAVNDVDGVVYGAFTGTLAEQTLSFTGFDIDFGNEVEVFINETSLGFLDAGVDEGTAEYEIVIAAGLQNDGEVDVISFVQDIDPNWKWGVTDILLGAAPEPPAIVPDFTLTLDILEEGDYGNNFGTAVNDVDGVVYGAFTGTLAEQTLSFTGFDIDFGNEVEVFINETSLGFLDAGVDEGTAEYEIVIAAGLQNDGEVDVISFVQDIDPNWKWGITDILLGAAPEPPAIVPDFTLTLDILEEGDYGNNFGTAVNDVDGVVYGAFTGTLAEQTLSFTGFDIDFGNEVEVFINETSLGFLDAGVDEGTAEYEIVIAAGLQNDGEVDVISFVQDIDPNWKWGVTDILLGAAPEPPAIVPDFTLTLDILEEGDYGNNFGTAVNDVDGVVYGAFTGTLAEQTLSFTGFDIDFGNEVEVFINETSLGFLDAGVDEGTAEYEIVIAAGLQNDGEVDVISFVQDIDPNWKWGVTDILLGDPPLAAETDVLIFDDLVV